MQRYIKDKINGNVILSMGENELPVENATEFLASRNLSPSDFEIGIASEEKVDQWIVEQAEASKTYAEKRKAEYDQLNQFELIGEDSINGTTNHKDAILAIKAKYPKE